MPLRCLTCLLLLPAVLVAADWPTHRGNAQRTGNVDGQPGPKSPKVLWVHRTTEHYIASPVVAGNAVLLPGLGAFNSAGLHALSLDAAPPGKQVQWSKTTPYLKLPVVSAPASADGLIVFGDGMHQTDGAVLHCLQANGGRMVWQLPVPGRLVHLEGAPAIAGGKVYLGGGNAGVLCVDLNRVTLNGQELDRAGVQATLDKKWKELQAKYEEEKKKDPDFAVPPNEDSLPKPAPRRLWQQGQDQWHVDASVTVIGDRVLAASAFLDDEKVGKRALFCLDAKDGAVKWERPLKLNPWAGPTVAGDLVILGGSSIRFDPQKLAQGRGEITAVDLASGQVKWHKDFPGGVVSPVAVANGMALFTATDGKVRALDVATGAEKWTYDGKAPFFAGPAVAGMVYAADLKGVVHAVALADGKKVWTLDLAADPVKAGGMVYGSPTVHGGRLYVATCNLEGERARMPTVVVCVGEK